jgi:hypothetical protein
MSERKPFIIFAVFLAVMAVLVFLATRGDDKRASSSNDDNTPTETTIALGTPESLATGTTLPPISVPTTVANAGPDQFRAVLEHLIAKQNELLQSPDPSRVGEIMDPTCVCYRQTREALQTMVDKKLHVQGPATGISAAALISKTNTEMRISATLVSLGNPTVEANGTVQQESKRGPLTPILYVLKKNSDGRWIIADRQTYEER